MTPTRFILPAIFLVAGAAFAQIIEQGNGERSADDPPTPAMSVPWLYYADDLELAERLGGLVFVQSELVREAVSAASVAVSEEALARADTPIVVARDGQWLVRFVSSQQRPAASEYDVLFNQEGEPVVATHSSAQPLAAEGSQMLLAKQTAAEDLPYVCSDRYSAVVLPSPAGGGIDGEA